MKEGHNGGRFSFVKSAFKLYLSLFQLSSEPVSMKIKGNHTKRTKKGADFSLV